MLKFKIIDYGIKPKIHKSMYEQTDYSRGYGIYNLREQLNNNKDKSMNQFNSKIQIQIKTYFFRCYLLIIEKRSKLVY